ncbi:MAG TPA: amidohydrolase family protein [Nitrososphaera sp.]|jgi:cytosine/adenosine deaminase-related metal-dependent hydrolase|nr:amidohydrolase family protein [Nitrososphaera sp.]
MSLVITNASLLLGKELDYVEKGYLAIEDGRISSAAEGNYKGSGKILDANGFLVIPGFINAHTHIADSIGKDVAASDGLDARVHPVFGAKKKILQSQPEHLKAFIRNSAISMMKKGIVAFADFREDGREGVVLLKEAIAGLPIKCVVLGRVNYYSNPRDAAGLPHEAIEQVQQVLEVAHGLGISGANENTNTTLSQYRQLARKKLIAIHVAESKATIEFSKEHAGRSEVDRVTDYLKPDFVVHMTNATEDEISLVAKRQTGVVICPRANGVLGAGIPRVALLLRQGCLVAIGTDNVMLNSPDILRELDYIWKASRATEGEMIKPRELLKMATVNAAEILRLNSGCIEAGRAADLIFIDKKHADLYPMHDPYAAVVHRLSQSSIRAIMIDGRFVEAVN